MRVHFIAIGGSAMHNLAIAMHQKGYIVTGSDDEIQEPSRTRLAIHQLLPAQIGWFPDKVTTATDAIILGMHARADNPELLRAQELGIKVFSYPEYIYEQTKNKTRVVIGGSHGKTTITAIILHVLSYHNKACDYMVGAQLQGFDTMVKLTADAPIAIIEGDEYLSSPIDRRPKFHLYHPDIAILSGIAWDHINVFPTFENYLDQFRIFINMITTGGCLIYCKEDEHVVNLVAENKLAIKKIPYGVPPYEIVSGITYLADRTVALNVFGNHNLMNINGARLVCNQLGINDNQFYEAITSFKGAAKRLELVGKNSFTNVYKDFAHSPSKLKATIAAVKQQFPSRKLVACMELHTFSSLNKDFLNLYAGSMALADKAFIYFNPHTIAHKKLAPITSDMIREAFDDNKQNKPANITVYTDAQKLVTDLLAFEWDNTNLLMMSSGNFDGLNFNELALKITG